jgi:hypothetical protein
VEEGVTDQVIDLAGLVWFDGGVGVSQTAGAQHAQGPALEGVTQAHVDRHLGVIDVQGEVAVTVGRILDGEAVVVIERVTPHLRKEGLPEGDGDLLEQIVDQPFEANLVEDQPVVIHRVRTAQRALLGGRQMLDEVQLAPELQAKIGREQGH